MERERERERERDSVSVPPPQTHTHTHTHTHARSYMTFLIFRKNSRLVYYTRLKSSRRQWLILLMILRAKAHSLQPYP